ncbi:GlcG/HbpS family heme-binding protein [Rhizobium leguminosarum]|uniref:GlcG/HbpS family heme-binding protein n=1 Tax=Rhizobium leguminosarum TaxID=384 RepID=UPI0021BBBE4E|nr:heme-binding protein [Rhizobium leguminosarum]
MLTIKRLDLNDARALIAGARAKAEEIGVPMCIAVADESGQLIAFERMDVEKSRAP